MAAMNTNQSANDAKYILSICVIVIAREICTSYAYYYMWIEIGIL